MSALVWWLRIIMSLQAAWHECSSHQHACKTTVSSRLLYCPAPPPPHPHPLPRAHAAPGYIAAWLSAPLPTSCEGLSARACYACQGLSTPSAIRGCLTCAKQSAPDEMEIFYNGIKATTRAETCAFCYNTTGANAEA